MTFKTIFLITLFISPFISFGQKTQKKPENVVKTIFKAAKSENYSKLSTLCDPKGDGDVLSVCNVENQPKHFQKEFNKAFKSGKITGNTIYEKKGKVKFAKVPFSFNGGSKKVNETMILVKRKRKWYLFSF